MNQTCRCLVQRCPAFRILGSKLSTTERDFGSVSRDPSVGAAGGVRPHGQQEGDDPHVPMGGSCQEGRAAMPVAAVHISFILDEKP